jgi:hypothetical protein
VDRLLDRATARHGGHLSFVGPAGDGTRVLVLYDIAATLDT